MGRFGTAAGSVFGRVAEGVCDREKFGFFRGLYMYVRIILAVIPTPQMFMSVSMDI
jgi:hypothetical protein